MIPLRPMLFVAFLSNPVFAHSDLPPYQERLPQDEIIYFVLPDRFENAQPANDRGGIDGGRLDHGFDPKHKGFYQGGDLQGLIKQLDYIQGLGATAVWLTPIFKNKAVQGVDPWISAGYHGYWITDFLDVDPHIGTRQDFKALVDAAHARNMKVYMDIITNHTADVIAYRECHDPNWQGEKAEGCPYRSLGDFPWTTRGGPNGTPINEGFMGDDPEHLTEANFARLSDPTWAYTPFVAEAEAAIKNPAWLNDMRYYHHRGETTWRGEDSLYGDFAGLDDLNTQHPQVVEGFIEIYKQWISDFRVDGFRIDTAKHVRPEFWAQFAPAIEQHAKDLGIEHFHIFGEVYEFDPGHLARQTIEARLPSVLDFAFQGAARAVIAGDEPASALDRLFAADVVYARGLATASILPTFLGNHDMGRFAGMVREQRPEISDDELFKRVRLAHGLMMFARGVPTIYYGDEQGFVSDGGDQDARESMFPSQTASHIDNDLIATDETVADGNFDTDHALYQAIAAMAKVRHENDLLRRGAMRVRHADLKGGLFVFSRVDTESRAEVVVAINTESAGREINVPVLGESQSWTALIGQCKPSSPAAGSYAMKVPALDFVVCAAVATSVN